MTQGDLETHGWDAAPCYNLFSPERVYVEADPVISSAGGSATQFLLLSDKLQIPRFARDDNS